MFRVLSHHKQDGGIKFRRLNLEERVKAKRRLMNLDPSLYRTHLFRKSKLDVLQAGKYNNNKTLLVRLKIESIE
jgi:hypothetical protein